MVISQVGADGSGPSAPHLEKKTLQFFPSFPSIPDYCCKYPETFRHGVSLPRKVWGLAVGSGSRRRAASPWSDEHSVFPGEQ